jgi:hypothetical protein
MALTRDRPSCYNAGNNRKPGRTTLWDHRVSEKLGIKCSHDYLRIACTETRIRTGQSQADGWTYTAARITLMKRAPYLGKGVVEMKGTGCDDERTIRAV